MIYWRSKKRLAALAVLLGTLVSGVSAKDLVHVVAKGETVYSISRQYSVSQEALMRRNAISDPSKLFEGMQLVIPSAASPASAPAPAYSGYFEYTVLPNETLYSIARSQAVVFQALCDINNFSKNYMVKAGEKIKIPKPAPAPLPAAVSSGAVIMPSWAALERPANARPIPKNPSIRWPVSAKEIYYMNGNVGALVSGAESESVKSLTKGTVVHASPWRGYGNVVIIEGEGGYRYLYGACKTLSVRKGDNIEAGTELGKLGIYPASGKPELVFIVSHNGSPVDPVKAPRH
ncbi:MAG: M23 family metallopeptidase [Treponema sp.]|jgi:murein DD-endopeptidase MepM/ murein hydrolase activator NlpD|nr:M23 family metallopeptidase [Treponema sp.]